MKLLLDTRLLLWAAGSSERVPAEARQMIEDARNTVCFSAASMWEIAAKQGLGRDDLRLDAATLYRGLLENGYHELPIRGAHALAALNLPPIHADMFDRLLIAQATVEGIALLTTDEMLARYPGPVRKVASP